MNKTDDMKKKTLEEFQQEAMREMGWNVDADIPMASAENLAILQGMEAMRNLKFELEQKVVRLDERNKAVKSHSINVQATLQQNTTFYNSVRNDVIKEAHRKQLVQLERNKLKEDMRRTQKEQKEFEQHIERVERQLALKKNEIDEVTSRIKVAKTALLEWNEAMEDGNKGYQLIDKYYRDDQQKAAELNTRRQKLQADIDKRRRFVVQLYDEQNTLEKNLERTACLYRAAHMERRQMVETWKHAVNQMTQRETDIQQGENECVELIEMARIKSVEYKAYDNKLNEIIENNRQVENTIDQLNDETADLKSQIQRLADASFLKKREIDGLLHELENLSNNVQLKRMENRKMQREKQKKTDEIESFGGVVKKVEERLHAMENQTLNAGQRLAILEEMNDNEDNMINDMAKEQQRVNDVLYRTQRQVSDMRDEEKTLMINTESLRSTLSAMRRSANGVETEIKRQTEIFYSMSFKYLEAERRLARMLGSSDDPEELLRQQETLANLENVYGQVQRRLATTEAHNKKLNYNMNTLVGVYNNDAQELEAVNYKIKEATVYSEGTARRLKIVQVENSDVIVELSLLKMRCQEMNVAMGLSVKGKLDLGSQRMSYQKMVKDRFVELRNQEDVLNIKRKDLTTELSTLRADLGDRRKHIDALRVRFELTSRLLGTNEDGTLVTATQLKVAAAQQRQLLADDGDVLNKKVIKAEQEVIALENTLRQFDRSNDNYRKTFRSSDDSSKDAAKAAEEYEKLQLLHCDDLNQLKVLRCKARRYELQREKQGTKEDELLKLLESAKQNVSDKEELLLQIKKELDEQNNKIERATREIRTALKEINQRPIGFEFLKMFEQDLDVQEVENRNTKALNMIVDMTTGDEDGPEIIHYMLRKGIKLPHHLQRTRSCVSWKSASSSSLDAGSYISSIKGRSARSSASDMSSIKDGSSTHLSESSTHLSVVSLSFPDKI